MKSVNDPAEPDEPSLRTERAKTFRGGGWGDSVEIKSSSRISCDRLSFGSEFMSLVIGFRLVCSVKRLI